MHMMKSFTFFLLSKEGIDRVVELKMSPLLHFPLIQWSIIVKLQANWINGQQSNGINRYTEKMLTPQSSSKISIEKLLSLNSLSQNEEQIKINSLFEKNVNLIPDIPTYWKIPWKDEYSPWKITISYDKERKPDIYSFSSLTVHMPNAEKCSKSWKNSYGKLRNNCESVTWWYSFKDILPPRRGSYEWRKRKNAT